MARDTRRRTVRQDAQAGQRPVELRSNRRFLTAQGNDSAIRTASALQRAFGAGTELASDIIDRRNRAGVQQAGADFATGNKDLDQKTKGYLDAWDQLEAERDINDMKKELPEFLRGANWEELGEAEVQGLINDYMQSKFEGIDPASAYASQWTPGALALNQELLGVHKDMQLQNIQIGQRQTIYGNMQARFEASRQIDEKSGEPIAGTESFDYDYLADQTRIFFDGSDKRTTYIEMLFDFAIQNGRPDIIENAPDRFASQDPTGVRDDLDEYRAALAAARRAEAVKIDADLKAAEAADKNLVTGLQFAIYTKRQAGEDFTNELRTLYGLAIDGRAEFGDYTAAKNFGDSQFDEREEHAPDYALASSLWNDIYSADAGIPEIYRAREAGVLGFGKTADDMMAKMMATVERLTPNASAVTSPEVTQLRSQLGQHYNPAQNGALGSLDKGRFHTKNLALDDYNDRVINGQDPVEAYQEVRQKYDAVIEQLPPFNPQEAQKTLSSAQFVRQYIITPQSISDVIDGKQSWSKLTSGIPQHVWVPALIEGVETGTITKEQLDKLGIEL